MQISQFTFLYVPFGLLIGKALFLFQDTVFTLRDPWDNPQKGFEPDYELKIEDDLLFRVSLALFFFFMRLWKNFNIFSSVLKIYLHLL